ncbi:ABC transporter ATP-binding protein [Litorihabitans aurantiacus]|uniref:ABC transporter ATP-binding protein n=1 Tax=Litorihabitans aurantiacus TaxID=1930061 RepID=A0AA37XGX6_9MICO|nr:ABC transporter ATP-binding protein [Litorihabitans aurantiacus]GMA32811.1 ABC transporter ATP-binding protein [Litorihabitans aurantiacus]
MSTTSPVPAAVLEGVTRTFDAVTALDDVSLTLEEGQLVGMLGPNGAGKSTLLSLVSGLRRPTRGTVRLFGRDPRDAASRILLGTTPQETGLPGTLKVREVVDFVGAHYPSPLPTGELIEMFGLTDLASRQTGGLSGGQKRRLAVALAIVGRPRIVLLDEPTTGLDVDARRVLWEAVRGYQASGACVVVTSHYLEEIEALAQRVVVIDGGRVLADDDLPTILARVGARHVRLTLADPADETRLRGLDGVVDVTIADGRTSVLTTDSDAVVRAIVRGDVDFTGLEVRGASLEEAFLAMTGPTGTTANGALR